MSHWYPALIIVVSVGLWGVMACECDDVTFVMSLRCQDDVKITLCQYSNSTGLWHSSIHQSEGSAENAAANQQPPISDIEQLISVDNMLVWSSLVISRTTDRLCELLLGSYQQSYKLLPSVIYIQMLNTLCSKYRSKSGHWWLLCFWLERQ